MARRELGAQPDLKSLRSADHKQGGNCYILSLPTSSNILRNNIFWIMKPVFLPLDIYTSFTAGCFRGTS